MVNYYDAHTHINSEKMIDKREYYLDLFVEAWGKWLINSWASHEYHTNNLEIHEAIRKSDKYKDIIFKSTVGHHPYECNEWFITEENFDAKMQEIRDLYLQNKEDVVAIWEAGIDMYFPWSEDYLEIQKRVFESHCQMAREFNLPLVVHSRDAFDYTLEILKNYTDLTIHFHCWSYTPEHVDALNSIFDNIYIGFCGNVTYKNAQNLRDSLAHVELDQLLLETDAPYLAPQVKRWETNHPAYVKYIYEFVAEELAMSVEKLWEILEKNTKKMYKLQ